MKNIILTLTAAIILISCSTQKTVNYGVLKFTNVTEYQNFLIEEGYSEAAAELISKTEFKLISNSAEYNALMED